VINIEVLRRHYNQKRQRWVYYVGLEAHVYTNYESTPSIHGISNVEYD